MSGQPLLEGTSMIAHTEARQLTEADRRRFPRFTPPPEASVRLRSGTQARLVDLGVGGALVESRLRLLPGSLTPVLLSGFSGDIRVKALIHRSSISGFVQSVQGKEPIYRAGLEFAALCPSDMNAVKALVDRACTIGEPRPSKIESDPLDAIQFPPGWAVSLKRSVGLATSPSGLGYMMASPSTRSQSVDLCAFAQASMRDAGLQVMHCRPAEINGREASVGFYAGWLDPLGEVMVEAAHVVLDTQTYLIAGIASWTAYETMRNEFFATISSFGRTRSADAVHPSPADLGSPSDAGDAQLESTDSRRSLRVAGPFDGVRVGLLETPIRVYDLSDGGCFIGSLHETAPGTLLVVRIQLPKEGSVTLKAEALYERPGFGYGVRFLEVADHVQSALRLVVRRTQERIRSQNRAGHRAEKKEA